jgi:hypothetical protein
MELPDDVLLLVREFSRPVTRPDWRRLHHMPAYKFHCYVRDTYNQLSLPIINWFVEHYDQSQYTYIYRHNYLFRWSPIQYIKLNLGYGN